MRAAKQLWIQATVVNHVFPLSLPWIKMYTSSLLFRSSSYKSDTSSEPLYIPNNRICGRMVWRPCLLLCPNKPVKTQWLVCQTREKSRKLNSFMKTNLKIALDVNVISFISSYIKNDSYGSHFSSPQPVDILLYVSLYSNPVGGAREIPGRPRPSLNILQSDVP